MASSSAEMARWTSFFTMSSYSPLTTLKSSRSRLRTSSEEMSEWCRKPLAIVGDQRVGDLVLHVARGDALHALARRLLAQLLDVVLGEAGQRLAVVELQLLEERQVVLLRLLEARQDAPHGRHLQRVRRDVLPADAVRVVVLLVDLHFLVELGDVRDVNLHGAIPQRLHELVVLELAVLGLV